LTLLRVFKNDSRALSASLLPVRNTARGLGAKNRYAKHTSATPHINRMYHIRAPRRPVDTERLRTCDNRPVTVLYTSVRTDNSVVSIVPKTLGTALNKDDTKLLNREVMVLPAVTVVVTASLKIVDNTLTTVAKTRSMVQGGVLKLLVSTW
jgi:hypothetical protein